MHTFNDRIIAKISHPHKRIEKITMW